MHDDDIERILVVMAHPDDVDFGAAGSIAHWTDIGVEVAYCVVTDGEAGGRHTGIGPADLADLRRVEQTAAAKVVGVTDLTFLGYPDGKLQSSIELRRDITRVIRRVRPQRLVCQSPERNYQRIFASHPDHLACGEAALSAVYPDALNPFAHPELLDEGYEPWVVAELYLMSAPDTYVDITDTADRKIEALHSHVSQMPDPQAIEQLIRRSGAVMAERAGLPSGHLAEGFLRIAAQDPSRPRPPPWKRVARELSPPVLYRGASRLSSLVRRRGPAAGRGRDEVSARTSTEHGHLAARWQSK
jgi:LmbE family N-acetylglucosaminyl deacetylase